MKNALRIATMALVAAVLMTACNRSDIPGYKKTKSGLYYKFEAEHKDAQQVKMGDWVVLEITMKLDTVLLYTGGPDRFKIQEPSFPGDLPEGLMMMHIGDTASFAIEADSVAKNFEEQDMPANYVRGKGMKLFYTIIIHDIISEQEIESEAANYQYALDSLRTAEPERISKYIADNNIKAQPDTSGLYVIVNKRGSGAKVANGKTVVVNFTGHTLDGTIFETNNEEVAKKNNIYSEKVPYQPYEFTFGQQQFRLPIDRGISGLPAGTSVTLLFPSKLAYDSRGAGNIIGPYEPLVYDIEIVSVK